MKAINKAVIAKAKEFVRIFAKVEPTRYVKEKLHFRIMLVIESEDFDTAHRNLSRSMPRGRGFRSVSIRADDTKVYVYRLTAKHYADRLVVLSEGSKSRRPTISFLQRTLIPW